MFLQVHKVYCYCDCPIYVIAGATKYSNRIVCLDLMLQTQKKQFCNEHADRLPPPP